MQSMECEMNVLDTIYSPSGDRLVLRLADIVDQLNDWLDRINDWYRPHNDAAGDVHDLSASFTWRSTYACIEVGDYCIWDTEDTGGELSFANCVTSIQTHIANLALVLDAAVAEVRRVEATRPCGG